MTDNVPALIAEIRNPKPDIQRGAHWWMQRARQAAAALAEQSQQREAAEQATYEGRENARKLGDWLFERNPRETEPDIAVVALRELVAAEAALATAWDGGYEARYKVERELDDWETLPLPTRINPYRAAATTEKDS